MLAIKGGKVVTITSGIIENGIILMDKGKIIDIGKNMDLPETAEIIDASEKWVTPGLIDAHTHIASMNMPLVSVGVTNANEMSNPVLPQINVKDGFNPHDIAVGISRRAGFTACYTTPGGCNMFGGTGFSFKLKEADNVDAMIIEGTEHMKMAFGENPRFFHRRFGKNPMTRMGIAAIMRDALFQAQAYLENNEKHENTYMSEFALKALLPVIKGEMKVRMHAHRADDIVSGIRIANEFHLKYVIEHCTEGYKITDYLSENNTDCIVGPFGHGCSKMEMWGCRWDTPALLDKAGIHFSLTEDGTSTTEFLPMNIGRTIAHGLSEKSAFEATTIRPARILGIDKRTGSIEKGKDADLAIWNGFPFSNLTLCEKTIIDGEVYNNLN